MSCPSTVVTYSLSTSDICCTMSRSSAINLHCSTDCSSRSSSLPAGQGGKGGRGGKGAKGRKTGQGLLRSNSYCSLSLATSLPETSERSSFSLRQLV